MPVDASGATSHSWRIAGAEKALLNSSGLTVVNDLTISDKIVHAGNTNTTIRFPANNTIALETNGIENVEFATSEVVFNDSGADIDFRIEGDTKANLFKVDAGTDSVSIDGAFTVTADTTLNSINGGALAGMRNRIINGGMDIAQRGTSFAAIANGTYSMDRWQWGRAGAMVCTVSQSTDVPNNTFQSSYKADVTTIDSSIAAGDYAQIVQNIEGYNVRDLIGTTFTFSFWVKSPKTGTHCVALRNSVSDRSFVKEYTIVTANTWEYKTLTVSGGLITAGTWNWTNGLGLNISFALACGSTFHTTADAWQTGNFIATANQVNVMDNTANNFFITGVQLEPGAVATPFERRIFGQELALCQRYYHFNNSSVTASQFSGNVTSGQEYQAVSCFPMQMRAAPSVTLTNAIVANFPATTGIATSSLWGVQEQRVANGTGRGVFRSTYTADAEL
jgi:hypothetical protein